jgi:hypothetical protein
MPHFESTKGAPTSFIHYATVAAATLERVSEVNSTPYLKVVAGVSLLILETVQVGPSPTFLISQSDLLCHQVCEDKQRAVCGAGGTNIRDSLCAN